MRTTIGAAGALAAVLLLASPAAAQHEGHGGHGEVEKPGPGVRADLVADMEAIEEKYVALAGAMREHWDWRPGEGVRSVGEVFGHVAAANMMIPTLFGIMPPEEFRGEDQQETMGKLMALEELGPDELAEHLAHSFMHARHAVSRVPDERLDETVQYFGQEGPVREVMILLTTHMHEHLGQSIAYARTNGVVPPWSQGGM